MNTIATSAVLIVALACPAFANPPEPAEVLTLDRALTIALDNAFSIQGAAYDVEIASKSVSAAKARRFPVLEATASETRHLTDESYEFQSGDFGNFPATGKIPDKDVSIGTQSNWATVAGARAILPVSEQYEIALEIDQVEVVEGLASEQLRAARMRIREQVQKTFYAIVETKAAIAAERESIRFLAELSVLVDRYVAEEVALAYESLEVAARLAVAEQQLREEHSDLATEREELNRLMGRPLEALFEISGTLTPRNEPMDPQVARSEALRQRPELRAADLEVERAENAYKLEGASFIPEINIVASYLRPFDNELLPDEFAQVAFEARWEFFTWGRRWNELGGKRMAIRGAQNRKQSTEASISIEVNERLRQLNDAVASVPVAELGEAAAREKRRVLMNRYREQTALLQRVLEADSELADASAAVRVAKLEVLTAEAELEHAIGFDPGALR